ncbi:MAG: TetR/AcrR family transcriptional regulator [Deltaproteobacteria bacterium]|nr:TetR/AcrR family transcriptional regulator [Deltaproteobacteria bacterium]MBW1737047.1 TetR/AcrR family transcriptional regulator [Deltaproteobacteria bacterium]MBW1909718.1 TetR/AcrR family transcriptional regulator [Deltaproteobacteria bacterium]MBW2033429.1 TetR/AcrR family transcriptional regulator [Deltaproteobacteria bacterium]MBW2114465.1 TetR/AcrR family transcriptional regulator [Deltaproteobacteria bacterium]
MTKKISKEDTRARIIGAATKLFAEHGYQQATISEIAKMGGLAEGSIYEHFRGKEDLLLTIPDVWVTEAIDELELQLLGIEGSLNKLRKFLWWYLHYIEREPLTAKVVFLFLKTNPNFMESEVYPNVKTFYAYLLKIFEEGRDTGEMMKDLDPFIARAIFLGTIEHMVIRWLLKGMTYSLFDNLEQTFKTLTDGFRNRQSQT